MPHRTYHIIDLNDVLNLKNHFHPNEGAHWENLPSGKVLLVTNFLDEGAEEHFLNLTQGSRLSLPHPVYEADEPISEEHAKHLHDHPHLFKEHEAAEHKLAAAKKCTVRDVAKRMAKINPKFRLF